MAPHSFLAAAVVTVALLLGAVAGGGRGGKAVAAADARDEPPALQFEDVFPRLLQRVRTSPVARNVMFGRDANHGADEPDGDGETPILYRVQDGRYDGALRRELAERMDTAVQRSKRYAGREEAPRGVDAGEARANADTSVVLLERAYPGFEVSDEELREDLTLRVWLCPDRTTARTLFWLRQRDLPLTPRPWRNERPESLDWVLECPPQSIGGPLPAGDDPPGEAAFECRAHLKIALALPRGDPRVGGSRISFIRGNVVVEALTWSYAKSADRWLWRGMSPEDRAQALSLLRDVDGYLTSIKSDVQNEGE